MLQKRFVKVILSFITLFCLLMAVTIFFVGRKSNTVYAEILCDLKSEYSVGEKFTVPDGKIKIDGKEYKATESMVIYPDGNGYSMDEYILSVDGKYDLIYTVEINEKKVSAHKEFIVKEGAYKFMTEKSSFCYGKNPIDFNGATEGINVKLADGDVFTFSKPVDITKYDANNPFVVLYPHNKVKVTKELVEKKDKDGNIITDAEGKPIMEEKYTSVLSDAPSEYMEAQKFCVKLTDCYNPSIFIEYEIMWVDGDNWAYYRAGANNQSKLGLYPGGTGVEIDGVQYEVRYNSGTNVGNHRAWNSGYSFSYDPLTTKVYVSEKAGTNRFFVTQLNNVDLYNANTFKGFTTGEVYVSVYGLNYSSPYMNFCVKEIDGLRGEDLDISTVSDEKAPEIEIDLRGGKSDSYIIAKGEEFELFDAKASDLNIDKSFGLKRALYYAYGSTAQTQINIENGKFTPNKVGEYTIVYFTKDQFDNTTTKLIKLNCRDCGKDGVISFNTTELKQINAGEMIKLPEYNIVGRNGEVDINIYALNTKTQKKTLIDKDSLLFTPDDIAEYELVYEYGDAVKSYRYTYKVNSVLSDFKIFNKKPILPKYLIKGMHYTFDRVTINVYTGDNTEEKETEVFIKEDGGEYKKADIKNIPINASENVVVKYSYGDGWEYECPAIPVVDVGSDSNIRLQDYFIGDFNKKVKSDSLCFTSLKDNGNNTLKFINPISFSLFEFKFFVPTDLSSYSGITIELTDYYNLNDTIKLQYSVVNDKLYLNSDENKPTMINSTFSDVNHSIYYNKYSNKFMDLTGLGVACNKNFVSDKVMLSITLNNISGNAGIEISNINNNTMNDFTFDLGAPQIVMTEQVSGIKQKGESVSVYPAIITDVLSPILTKDISLKVKGPDEKFITSKDGIQLDGSCDVSRVYEIELDKYGIYVVSYTAYDQNGKNYIYSYNIVVRNQIAPEIKISGVDSDDHLIKCKLGEVAGLPHFTVTDDNTPEGEIKSAVIVFSPTNELIYVEDYAFIADVKGEYIVNYYAYDADGNYSVKTIKVIVE